MKWSKPKVTSLSMNAEIGAYQNDFGGDYPPFVSGEVTPAHDHRSVDPSATPAQRREPAR